MNSERNHIEKAKQEYHSGNVQTKEALEKIFGKDIFANDDYMKIFTTFCMNNNLKITYDYSQRKTGGYVYLPHKNPIDSIDEHENASAMIRTIISLNNKRHSFIVDYINKNQKRWFPIAEVTSSGLVFSDADCEDWFSDADAGVGSPFVSPTSEEAKRLFIEYLPIYEKYYIIKK